MELELEGDGEVERGRSIGEGKWFVPKVGQMLVGRHEGGWDAEGLRLASFGGKRGAGDFWGMATVPFEGHSAMYSTVLL